MSTEIDGMFARIATYGSPFHTALTCLKCGVMIDGGTYTPAPPRTVHAQWHEVLDALLSDLQHRETLAAERDER